MKKIIMAVSFVAAAGSVLAASDFPTAGTAVTGGAQGNCTLIGESVIPRTSNNVKGSYNCNATTNYIGVGTASTAGKDKAFGASNKGGTMVTETCGSVAANAQTCAGTAADHASNT